MWLRGAYLATHYKPPVSLCIPEMKNAIVAFWKSSLQVSHLRGCQFFIRFFGIVIM